MAKVWVKGYTKPDGTKVKGHYREVPGPFGMKRTSLPDEKKKRNALANRIRFGQSPQEASDAMARLDKRKNPYKQLSPARMKRVYVNSLIRGEKEYILKDIRKRT